MLCKKMEFRSFSPWETAGSGRFCEDKHHDGRCSGKFVVEARKCGCSKPGRPCRLNGKKVIMRGRKHFLGVKTRLISGVLKSIKIKK